MTLTAVVPTYGRESVLIDTISMLLDQPKAPDELMVVDQTRVHSAHTEHALQKWHDMQAVRWIQLAQPSITHAMNVALEEARSPIVLFLDDDVIPAHGLIEAHLRCYTDPSVWAVMGQVLQPGEEPMPWERTDERNGLWQGLGFPFNSAKPADVHNVMACNLSVRRERALQVGGFDENFVRVAYRFETDFARRLVAAGGRIMFAPSASIRHLRISSGGTRMFLDHRRSHRPDHSVGDYYYAFRHGRRWECWTYSGRRLVRSVLTKYHLRRPWWIVPKLIGELRGLNLAIRLARRGPKLLKNDACNATEGPTTSTTE